MTADEFTVLGASGFIGSQLVEHLASHSVPCWAPGRREDVLGRPLGHVIYCIGVTADFRQRPFDTVRAHACRLADVLERARFASFLYLSTTRIYRSADSSREDAVLRVRPERPDDLYDISKLMGESLCLTRDEPGVRVARLSNVFGADFGSANFLSSVVRDAVDKRHVTLGTTMSSEKDYVSIDDVASLLPQIARSGRRRLYNVASGANTTNRALMDALRRETGCTVAVADDATASVHPSITVDRIREEFGASPRSLLDAVGDLVALYRRKAVP